MKPRVFRVEGYMRIGDEERKFSIEITATRESDALEEVYSRLGSRHKLKRRHIKVKQIKEISPEEVQNAYIKKLLELDRIVVPG